MLDSCFGERINHNLGNIRKGNNVVTVKEIYIPLNSNPIKLLKNLINPAVSHVPQMNMPRMAQSILPLDKLLSFSRKAKTKAK